MCGVYNLGFLGLRLDDKTASFLDWWCDRLHRYCIVDLANGMFVDQSWMDFAPAYLESVAVVRDPIFNIAYWNLPHRKLERAGDQWRVDGRRVGFFHFSGVNLDDLDIISRHQDRTDLWRRPELRPLFDGYRELVAQSGQEDVGGIPYHWDRFTGTEVEIPWVSRIALQEVDPLGLRWPDPFDTEAPDSFLAWLAERLDLDGRIVNRTLLYLWRERPDIRAEFPVIDGNELDRYLAWYKEKGAAEGGLDNIFVEPLQPLPLPPPLPPRPEPPPHDDEREEAARIDLNHPGEKTAWLNEPAVEGDGPLVSRLAMVIHRTRPDVNKLYPNPYENDRAGLAYWMALHGVRDHHLHEDLVRPIRESLSGKNRLTLQFRKLWLDLAGGAPEEPMVIDPPPPPPPPEDPPEPPKPPEPPWPKWMRGLIEARPTVGVNLVGRFESATSFAAGIREALREAGVAHATVALDHELPDETTTDRIRHEEGAPFSLTILTIPPQEWRRTLSRLPLGSRYGGRVIGYVNDTSFSLSSEQAALVDEMWTPTEELARAVSKNTHVPVRVVPPVVGPPSDSTPDIVPDLDPDRFWFLALSGGRGSEDERALSAAIECVRRLASDGDSRFGLCLAAGPEKRDLAVQLAHLPIRVVARPIDTATVNTLINSCDGYLDLHRALRVDPVLVKAALSGKPVVAGWSSSFVAQDEESDFNFAMQRIAEVLAHPDVEMDLATALMDSAKKEHNPEIASRAWGMQIDNLATEISREESSAVGQRIDLETDQ
jgi:hypothetical protein